MLETFESLKSGIIQSYRQQVFQAVDNTNANIGHGFFFRAYIPHADEKLGMSKIEIEKK